MKVKELGHIVLTVADLKKSAHFYGDVLGFKEVFRREDRSVMYSAGRTHHELFLQQAGPDAAPIPPGRPLGLTHFALKVGDTDDELRAALDEVKEAGVTIDHMTDHGVTHSIYLRDPDNNLVEIYIDPSDRWREDPTIIGSAAKELVL